MSDQTSSQEPAAEESSGEAAAAPGTGEVTKDERNIALLCHILGFLTSFVGPLIIWLIKKDRSAYVGHHSREAMNFQITMLIGYLLGFVLTITVVLALLGCVIWPVVFVVSLVFSIIAMIAASKGEWYRYPIAIRLIK